MPEARAAYQKALSMSQQRAGKKIFKKRLAELSNLGDAKRLRVQDK
jgi:predicted negative regulator of RcsB-dependent stress response